MTHRRASKAFAYLSATLTLVSAAMGYWAIWGRDDRWGSTAALTLGFAALFFVLCLMTTDVSD